MHPPFFFLLRRRRPPLPGPTPLVPVGGGQRTVVVTESPQEPRRAASDHCQPPPPRAPSACRTAAGDNHMSPPRLRVYRRARQQGLCVIDSTSFMHMQHAVNYPQMPLCSSASGYTAASIRTHSIRSVHPLFVHTFSAASQVRAFPTLP